MNLLSPIISLFGHHGPISTPLGKDLYLPQPQYLQRREAWELSQEDTWVQVADILKVSHHKAKDKWISKYSLRQGLASGLLCLLQQIFD